MKIVRKGENVSINAKCVFQFSEIKIQPELNNKLIPSHYRGEPANSSSGGGSSAVDSSEGAAAAAVNDN